ncbi:MAG: endonuclease III [Caldilineaceae bacterium]|nr:endonuclease III [Caldilineaceae bacterium]
MATAVNAVFDIDEAFARLEEAVEPFPKAALFALAEEGFHSPFEQLVACILSIRTKDEVTLPCARKLFAVARTPAALQALPFDQLHDLIRASTFHAGKTTQLLAIAATLLREYNGEVPCDFAVLTAFSGVGPKCANLVLGIACGQSRISVDVHVHRVTNRWGYVATTSPEKTMVQLEAKLPQRYWVAINRLLVPFGKHICTGTRPHCSTCPLLAMCQQVGVENPR